MELTADPSFQLLAFVSGIQTSIGRPTFLFANFPYISRPINPDVMFIIGPSAATTNHELFVLSGHSVLVGVTH